MANPTKPLIVPSWNGLSLSLYTPGTQTAPTGQAVANAKFNVSQTVWTPLFPGAPGIPNPNSCCVEGNDVYFSLSGPGQGIVKLPNFLKDPAAAIAAAFVIDLNQSDYVGLAVDANGNLYGAAGADPEGADPGNQIWLYPNARTAISAVAGISLGNAGKKAYFGNLRFDAVGNLWATDYWNNRLVVFQAAALQTHTAVTVVIDNPAGPLNLANNNFATTLPFLFASPEGLDFDLAGNLWVANNNDFGNSVGAGNEITTIVKLTALAVSKIQVQIAAGAGAYALAPADFSIYPLPAYSGAKLPQLGGLAIDAASQWLFVNDETPDASGHGWVRGYYLGATAPSNDPSVVPLAAIANNAADTSSRVVSNQSTPVNPIGNGGIAIVPLGAWIGDTGSDSGVEPDSSALNIAWDSRNIVAAGAVDNAVPGVGGTLPTPATDPSGSNTILGGAGLRNIYVRVDNFSKTTPTGGLDVVNVYWAKGSATLDWPIPWDGNGPSDPQQQEPLGGIVALGAPVGVIPPGGYTIVGPIAWTKIPDPTKYLGDDGHFCLLARVVTPNAHYFENVSPDTPGGTNPPDSSLMAYAGMSFPERGGSHALLIDNVVDNARIAWRNIHIANPGDNSGAFIRINHLAFGGRLKTTMHVRISLELLNARQVAVEVPANLLHVRASGRSLEALEKSSLGRFARELPRHARHGEHRRHPLRLPSHGISGIPVGHGETIGFHVEVDRSDEHRLHNHALRASAWVVVDGQERLVGGQTFVFGHVLGLHNG